MPICKLCKKEADLEGSHILPAFAVRWLKETGATSYLRTAVTPNKRVQDAKKIELLCRACEALFGVNEELFARTIFRPYVDKELNDQGEGTGTIKEFKYEPWLLHFIISLQWRTIATLDGQEIINPDHNQYSPVLAEFEKNWREFLLGTRKDTGPCETHMVFLQSLTAASRTSNFSQLGKNANYYILRSIDATVISGKRKLLAIYSKLGPIAFFTSILPATMDRTPDSRIRMRGEIATGQSVQNALIGRFIFTTRPNEIGGVFDISNKQNEIIIRDMRKDMEKTRKSLTHKAFMGDLWVEKLKDT